MGGNLYEEVCRIWYEQDILKYKTNEGGFKLINFKGEEITSSVYSNVYSLAGVENSIIVEANGVKGLVNGSTNQVVLQCSYTKIEHGKIAQKQVQKMPMSPITMGKVHNVFFCTSISTFHALTLNFLIHIISLKMLKN